MEQWEAQRQRWNKGKIRPPFEAGDVVKAHVQVKSNANQGDVKKLSYQSRGPFQIAKILGNNSYKVKRYNKPDSAVCKYKGRNLYLLPPAIFPRDPLDITDQQYLNYDHAPVISLLKKKMNIKLYNYTYLSAKVQHTFSSNSNHIYLAFIDTIAFKLHKTKPTITTTAELFQ